eukprot:6492424-Amphidinium_carterae.1
MTKVFVPSKFKNGSCFSTRHLVRHASSTRALAGSSSAASPSSSTIPRGSSAPSDSDASSANLPSSNSSKSGSVASCTLTHWRMLSTLFSSDIVVYLLLHLSPRDEQQPLTRAVFVLAGKQYSGTWARAASTSARGAVISMYNASAS